MVTTVAELLAKFGSFVPEVIVATSTICVWFTVPALTVTTTVNWLLFPFAMSGFVQEIFPVLPTAGVAQFHPEGIVMDWKVVFVGIASAKTAFSASKGPLFVTVWV
jgi:hypothetical protein